MEENHNKIMYRVLQSFLDFSASILLNKIKYISKVELYIWYADLLGKNYDKTKIRILKSERVSGLPLQQSVECPHLPQVPSPLHARGHGIHMNKEGEGCPKWRQCVSEQHVFM